MTRFCLRSSSAVAMRTGKDRRSDSERARGGRMENSGSKESKLKMWRVALAKCLMAATSDFWASFDILRSLDVEPKGISPALSIALGKKLAWFIPTHTQWAKKHEFDLEL